MPKSHPAQVVVLAIALSLDAASTAPMRSVGDVAVNNPQRLLPPNTTTVEILNDTAQKGFAEGMQSAEHSEVLF